MNDQWQSVILDSLPMSEKEFVTSGIKSVSTLPVTVPHNWDQYYGYRRGKHGNLHGTAWYYKTFSLDNYQQGKRYFLFFEGVGSYATIWVNGQKIGEHKGGRTSFTVDATEAIDSNGINSLVVKASHPAFIADLPWVCGGCSGEWGFSEGSQPMGIFRPVTMLVTNNVRVQPFGVHIYKTGSFSNKEVNLKVSTELKNYGDEDQNILVTNSLQDKDGNIVASTQTKILLASDSQQKIKQSLPVIQNPELWSPENPYLYNLVTEIEDDNEVLDRIETSYGVRWVSWPLTRNDGDNKLYINEKSYFLNGTCEYEHLMGNSHSFSNQQISSRIHQIKDAGFNAFREGHQPHNLKYQEYLDKEGILFWSQFSAHIWYDTPAFKENFKILLKEWIKERRNSPSVIMWGLQNESTIPKEFAEICTEIIREMDPSASTERLVTTCNGGEGTDWNVIQNWSGTYGGDPFNYDNELKKDLLNGEYGAWRTADMHTEGYFKQKGAYSEERFSQLMEIKIAEAEIVKDSVIGHFNWLFSSHENPGRIQNGEAYRDIDRIGPVNYKGLFTAWGEPLDAYYMYAGNYASKEINPMVYIVSHSWPNRWTEPARNDSIVVYSNCDEVELFNDINGTSFGRKKNPGKGKHFLWDGVDLNYNVLYAKGYVNGIEKTSDRIVLNNLPESPNFDQLFTDKDVIKPTEKRNYLYRVNAGGPEFTDSFGNFWMADVHRTDYKTWGSKSWTDSFDNLHDFYGSQRRIFDPITDTRNWQLFQTFRYGNNDQLKYEFPLENGVYTVELFFTEPWYGVGSDTNCKGYRTFNVALNNTVVEHDLDIWEETGFAGALKKTYEVEVVNGLLTVSFPEVNSGEAVISAIAIAGKKQNVAKASPGNIQNLMLSNQDVVKIQSWLDINQRQYNDASVKWNELPYQLFGAEWLQFSSALFMKEFSGNFSVGKPSDIYLLLEENVTEKTAWIENFEVIAGQAKTTDGITYKLYKKTGNAETVFSFTNLKEKSKFCLVVVPTYEMGEEEEERPNITLKAKEGKIEGAYYTDIHRKSEYVGFNGKTDNSIEWEVKTGLAGIHLLRFKYMNMNDTAVKVRLEIIAPNGAKMRDDFISFPVKQKKFKILNTTTGGFINAGTYTIRISGDDLNGLRLESFDFQ
ncbi:hypothetical protein Y10_19720 [Neptunitalea sp. Y10]|uniref:Beta-galactosidase n=2 Tax=Neptunitalea lumnitzerae TaxID=2965509 RepID=A0ABQ5MJM9_9FLAO|nr:hypothetical protein Y10_19720 [Neptunitalea sp. Y10]